MLKTSLLETWQLSNKVIKLELAKLWKLKQTRSNFIGTDPLRQKTWHVIAGNSTLVGKLTTEKWNIVNRKQEEK